MTSREKRKISKSALLPPTTPPFAALLTEGVYPPEGHDRK